MNIVLLRPMNRTMLETMTMMMTMIMMIIMVMKSETSCMGYCFRLLPW
jgi:hypothetical protein